MRIVIDGYNLLHASGVFATETGPDTLQQSRRALLDALADQLDPRLVKQTMIVFDAAGAPPGLPRKAEHRGLVIRYASPQADADQLIEEIVDAHRSPRELLVVSSDHRVQRAARRRGAESIDSERWFAELSRQARQRKVKNIADPASRGTGTSNAEVQYWLRQFGIESTEEGEAGEPRIDKPLAGDSAAEGLPDELADEAIDEPIFPPGYGEDLLEDEDV